MLTGLYELGGTGQEAQRLLGSLFGAGTIVTLAVLGRRVGGDRVGLIAAAVAAVYPMLITADGALMSESLYGFLVALRCSPPSAAGTRRDGAGARRSAGSRDWRR